MASFTLRTVPVTSTIALLFRADERVGYVTLDSSVRQTGFAVIDGIALQATANDKPVEVAVCDAYDAAVARVNGSSFANLDAIFDTNDRLTRRINEALNNFDATGSFSRLDAAREAANA